MSDLIVFTYPGEDEAVKNLEKLAGAKKENIHEAAVTVVDAAVALKREDSKVKITQTLEMAIKGTNLVSGGLWGMVIGLLFGGPLIGGLVGMGLRALGNRSLDIGIDNDFIKSVSEALEPGHSAMFVLTKNTKPSVINEILGDHNGVLHHTSLSEEAAAALTEISADEDVANALEEVNKDI